MALPKPTLAVKTQPSIASVLAFRHIVPPCHPLHRLLYYCASHILLLYYIASDLASRHIAPPCHPLRRSLNYCIAYFTTLLLSLPFLLPDIALPCHPLHRFTTVLRIFDYLLYHYRFRSCFQTYCAALPSFASLTFFRFPFPCSMVCVCVCVCVCSRACFGCERVLTLVHERETERH
jgi:hypothetical protein